MRTRVYEILCEALRRFECFAVRRDGKKWNLSDLQKAWTGLGFPSYYKPAVKGGYIHTLHDEPTVPRCMGWYLLTEKGAKVVLEWHKQGYACIEGGYTMKNNPPFPKEVA